jgi:hypothetical protein
VGVTLSEPGEANEMKRKLSSLLVASFAFLCPEHFVLKNTVLGSNSVF